MMPPNDLNVMFINVVELEELYLFAKDYFYIHWLSFEKN